MSRHSVLDYLQEHRFWVADATPQLFDPDLLGAFPFWALSPALGFSKITAPEIDLDTKIVQPGGDHRTIAVVKRANTSAVTLSRGVVWYESDLHRWVMRAAQGLGAPRRDLVIFSFMNAGMSLDQDPGEAVGIALGAGAIAGLGSGMAGGAAAGAVSGASTAASLLALAALNQATGDDSVLRIPARAWYLEGCIPTRYVPMSGFDASSAQISIADLTVQPMFVDEISLLG